MKSCFVKIVTFTFSLGILYVVYHSILDRQISDLRRTKNRFESIAQFLAIHYPEGMPSNRSFVEILENHSAEFNFGGTSTVGRNPLPDYLPDGDYVTNPHLIVLAHDLEAPVVCRRSFRIGFRNKWCELRADWKVQIVEAENGKELDSRN